MPKQQWEGATVGDLMACLESRLDPMEGLQVVSLSLFRSRLKTDHELHLLLPALLEPFPCVLAVAQQAIASSMIELTVKTLTGKAIVLKCSTKSTVLEVKKLLHKKEGIRPDYQRLVFDRRELEDATTLQRAGVKSGGALHLVLRLRGGGFDSTPFANVADDSLLVEISFGKAPKWRGCGQGLNIEGRCDNAVCSAYGRMVICQNRYEPFNLIQEKTVCPICYTKVNPVTCGFYNCEWTFQGVRSSDGMRMSSPWKIAAGDRYHRFNATETSGSIQWASLLITAKPVRASLPTASPRACSACTDSLSSTLPKAALVAGCGHHFHKTCYADLATTQVAMGVLCACPVCGDPMDNDYSVSIPEVKSTHGPVGRRDSTSAGSCNSRKLPLLSIRRVIRVSKCSCVSPHFEVFAIHFFSYFVSRLCCTLYQYGHPEDGVNSVLDSPRKL